MYLKNKIKYLLDEEKAKQYSEVLPMLMEKLREMNYNIERKQETIDRLKKSLKIDTEDLGTFVNNRNQIIAVLKDLV